MISKSLHFVDSLELLTLADFWSRFEIIYGKQERVSDEADDDFDKENEKKTSPTNISIERWFWTYKGT